MTPADADPPFLDWLRRHGQTPRTIDRFWGVVLTSALNESPDRVGLRYARKVFVDGFLRHRRGFEVDLPAVPLGRLYGDELLAWLDQHAVRLLLGRAARALHVRGDRVQGVELREGGAVGADWYVAAVPFDRLLDLLPADAADEYPAFAGLRNLETSPITSVHLWYDRPITDLPHVVLIDCVGQWVFNRGEVCARRALRPGGRQRRPAVPRPGTRGGAAGGSRRRWPGCSPRRPGRRCCGRGW